MVVRGCERTQRVSQRNASTAAAPSSSSWRTLSTDPIRGCVVLGECEKCVWSQWNCRLMGSDVVQLLYHGTGQNVFCKASNLVARRDTTACDDERKARGISQLEKIRNTSLSLPARSTREWHLSQRNAASVSCAVTSFGTGGTAQPKGRNRSRL